MDNQPTPAAYRLLMEGFQLLATDANETRSAQIGQYIAAQQATMGDQLLQAFPTVAAAFFNRASSTSALERLVPIAFFADAICLATAGDRAMNIELAIVAYNQFEKMLATNNISAPLLLLGMMKMGLGIAYKDRIIEDRSNNVEQSLVLFEQALRLVSRRDTPAQWGLIMMNFSTAYQVRIKGDRSDNREKAITLCEQALNYIKPEDNPVIWTTTMTNLATSYKDRTKGDRAENLETAIRLFQDCLKVRTLKRMPTKWPKTMNNLGLAYFDRIEGDPAENIEKAISTFEQIFQLDLKNEAPLDWVSLMSNLATAYKDRIRGDAANNIEKSIALYNQLFEVVTEANAPYIWATAKGNIALAYAKRTKGNQTKNIEAAIAASEAALRVFRPQRYPNDCRRVVHKLGDFYTTRQQWANAVSTYRKGLTASDVLYQSSLSLSSQDVEIKDTYDMSRRMAYAQAKTGELAGAVVSIEQGRARKLRNALNRDRADLADLAQADLALYERYQTAAAAIRKLEAEERLAADPSQPPNQASDRKAAFIYDQYNTVVASIRNHPGYEDFLSETDINSIAAVINPGQPLVYILISSIGSCAFILTKQPTTRETNPTETNCTEQKSLDITPIWLTDFTEDQLKDLIIVRGETAEGWLEDYFAGYHREHLARWKTTIKKTTAQLWQPVMEPIVDFLENRDIHQATLIPTSYLSLLPLHAAWTETSTQPSVRRYALDNICFTYAPNARSLKSTQRIAHRTQIDSILVIEEPTHQYLTKDNGYKPVEPLPNAAREVQAVLSSFKVAASLRHEAATKNSVLSGLSQHQVLHCSCHGKVDFEEPLKSGLSLAGRGETAVLSLRDLLELNLQGLRLAVLSACETGVPGLEFEDEVVSLPTGLLQAGAAGVVASLWQVSDLGTMLLISRFYKLWQSEIDKPAKALAEAQRWLLEANYTDLLAHCKTFIPELFEQTAESLPTRELLERGLQLDYSHPYYWAAFSYTGT